MGTSNGDGGNYCDVTTSVPLNCFKWRVSRQVLELPGVHVTVFIWVTYLLTKPPGRPA